MKKQKERYYCSYPCFIGDILLESDGQVLTGLWFEDEKATETPNEREEKMLPVFEKTIRWLDLYVNGAQPDFVPEYRLEGSKFQMEVWKYLEEIPYGKTVSYGEIAKKIAKERGIARMSAQAVGGAVGKNPISIIVPCHRVIGSDGSLVGYGGGLDRKVILLAIERKMGY